VPQQTLIVSVKIKVIIPNSRFPENPTIYHVSLREAKHLTATNQGEWVNPTCVRRAPDTSTRCIWTPTISGGYNVMQLR
jgi:hypothetical protein